MFPYPYPSLSSHTGYLKQSHLRGLPSVTENTKADLKHNIRIWKIENFQANNIFLRFIQYTIGPSNMSKSSFTRLGFVACFMVLIIITIYISARDVDGKAMSSLSTRKRSSDITNRHIWDLILNKIKRGNAKFFKGIDKA